MCCQQRVSADIKKVVRNTHFLDAKHILPDLFQHFALADIRRVTALYYYLMRDSSLIAVRRASEHLLRYLRIPHKQCLNFYVGACDDLAENFHVVFKHAKNPLDLEEAGIKVDLKPPFAVAIFDKGGAEIQNRVAAIHHVWIRDHLPERMRP